MRNIKITQSLITKKEISFKNLNQTQQLNPLFKELFESIQEYDFESYKNNLKDEIQNNLEIWWTNPKNGINLTEKLSAIMFEFTNYFYEKNPEAESYGLKSFKNHHLHTDNFILSEIDDSSNFCAMGGLTLPFLNQFIEKLFLNELPTELKKEDREEIKGYKDLLDFYLYSGFEIINKAFLELNQQELFNKINKQDKFLFIIQSHDSEYSIPLLAIDL
jgi:hypothetical protein